MKLRTIFAATLVATGALTLTQAARAAGETVGVSWSNFQEERWKTDEAAIKAALEKAGLKYISADAAGSAEKQAADVESLITKGAKALIILAWDQDAILPSVQKAKQRGIPVIAYDRLIQDKDVTYLTFNNVEVGRMQAREVFKVSALMLIFGPDFATRQTWARDLLAARPPDAPVADDLYDAGVAHVRAGESS